MDWVVLADAFVTLMQALSLGSLCAGAVMSIREGLDQCHMSPGDKSPRTLLKQISVIPKGWRDLGPCAPALRAKIVTIQRVLVVRR